jgi:hypothetical protein
MKVRSILPVFVVASLAAAQGPIISITPHASLAPNPGTHPAPKLSSTPEARRVPAVGAAVLGYLTGPGPAEIRPIFGTAQRPQLGAPAAVPTSAQKLYLPPRQQYVLLEQSAAEPLAVWALHRAIAHNENPEPIALPGVMAHPDLVVFSPRGDAAALYSQAAATLQIITHLPAEPSTGRQISMAALGTPSQLAITDDGALVVAALADQRLVFSFGGATWQPLTTAYTPQAWTFVPNTHDLAISDMAQKTIVLLSNLSETSKMVRVLSPDVAADRLAVTKSGDQLVAANSIAGQVWTIDLKTAALTPRDGFAKVDTLSSLRDGLTFLLSASPSISVLKLAALPESQDLANIAR